jgi:RNA polymerase sigma-70 factor (ECF subfamily)
VLAHGKKKASDRHVFRDEIIDRLADELQQNNLLYQQRQDALQNCLEKLRPKDRELLSQRYAGRTSTVDLANRLQKPLSTLYKSLRRIRQGLLECINTHIRREDHAG